MFKTVEYAYPSSPNADALGFKKGCYTVETCETPYGIYEALAGYATREEAIKAALNIGGEWSPDFLRWHADWLKDAA